MSAPPLAQAQTDIREGQRGALAGTGTMVRFMLRRDRIRFPAWTLGMAAMMAYFANFLPQAFDDEAALQGLVDFSTSPIGSLLGGPGFGFDDITLARFLVGQYGLYLIVAAALMSILTISRHTRVEEQTGRAELVRANVVGRHAQLTAALFITVAMNAVMAGLMWLVLISSAMDTEPASAALLFACSIGAAGIAFAGVSAVTVQLSPFSRAASGIAGAVLGAAFVLRGLGDMSAQTDGGLDWLAWLSPVGWSQQTAPYTHNRWAPILLSIGFAIVLAGVGYALQSRRDLGAGMFAARPGSPTAPNWLSTPLTLAFRLQRGSLIGWTIALAVAGLSYGFFTEPLQTGLAGMPDEMLELMGGEGDLTNGYMGLMGLLYGITVAVFAILSVLSLRNEEQSYRTEPVLAAGVSRIAYLVSWTTISALGVAWLLLVAGLTDGLGAAISTGDWGLFGPTLAGHVAHTPAAWFVLGLAVLAYAIYPRLVGLVWLVFAYGFFMSFFGQMLDMPDAANNLSVFMHIGEYPAEDISWTAVGILAVSAMALTAAAAAAFRRRDLTTA